MWSGPVTVSSPSRPKNPSRRSRRGLSPPATRPNRSSTRTSAGRCASPTPTGPGCRSMSSSVSSTPETDDRTRAADRPGALLLAVGIVALEFAAAVSRFVAWTLLPVITDELDARDELALLVAGSTLGLFVALPLATPAVRALGTRALLAVATSAYLGGLAVSATATQAWIFGLGQFVGGLASGLLAVFGVSTAIRRLDDDLRVKVVAASSAMWILPALVGPASTLALEDLIGWRWTLLVPVPILLLGRMLVARSVEDEPPAEDERPLGRTMLVPVGAAAIVLGGSRWPVTAAGALLALAGVTAIMPAGTTRLARGAPAALAALTLFAIGYFGADGLITILLTDAYGATPAEAGIVLGAAPLAWALTSVVVARVGNEAHRARLPAIGLALSAIGAAAVMFGSVTAQVFAVALAGWPLTGVGVGLAYPVLYVRATTPGAGARDAAQLATAVITAEAFGSVLGGALGATIGSHGGSAGLAAAYGLFTVALMIAAYA